MARIDTSKLHPRFANLISQLENQCAAKGLAIEFSTGYRSAAEQDALYAQGRTTAGSIVTNARGGYSQHNWGIAADFFQNIKGREWENWFFDTVGPMAESLGMGWGGRWTDFPDRPHLYLPDWGDMPTALINAYGLHGYDAFRATWGGSSVAPSQPSQGGSVDGWKATGTATATDDGVWFVATPGDKSTLIQYFNTGNRFEVDGQKSGHWIHAMSGGRTGWVSENYVAYDGPSHDEVSGSTLISAGQIHANNYVNAGLIVDGVRGDLTKHAGIKCVQQAMNMDYGAGLAVDGEWGPKSDSALKGHYVEHGEEQEMVRALQILLYLNNYNPNGVDAHFGDGCKAAVGEAQQDHGLTLDYVAGYNTFKTLMGV